VKEHHMQAGDGKTGESPPRQSAGTGHSPGRRDCPSNLRKNRGAKRHATAKYRFIALIWRPVARPAERAAGTAQTLRQPPAATCGNLTHLAKDLEGSAAIEHAAGPLWVDGGPLRSNAWRRFYPVEQ
jgi:hypothetical protein